MRPDIDAIEKLAYVEGRGALRLVSCEDIIWLCAQARRLERVREIVNQDGDDVRWMHCETDQVLSLERKLRQLRAAVEENDA